MENSNFLLTKIQIKIDGGHDLIRKLKDLQNIDGIMKLQRKIQQEIQFLEKLKSSKKFKEEQLSCSNLRHLGALVDCACKVGVEAVCKVFHMNDNSKLEVDVISDKGHIWTKVIARNPKSLSALSQGNASYKARSILDQANDYLEGAKLYPCMYQPPKVVFEFASGIEETLANKLDNIGISVKGDILPNSFSNDYSSDDSYESDCSEDETSKLNYDLRDNSENMEIDTLNLDVTAMMAYVSNMTNGYCHYIFKQTVLTQQSYWESQRPVKPVLDKLFQGKKLICCDTAWNDFSTIIDTLGGKNEKERAENLKSLITVLPDDSDGPDDERRANLEVRGHVRKRAKIIFNFGHRRKALTVSANEGFVRAAMQQGVNYTVYIHESRALTEGKEVTATKIVN